MKKLFLFLYFTFYIFNSAFSQNPLVKQWDYRFGGTLNDWLFSFQQTFDGGYILGGFSASGISGDKTEPSWGGFHGDYWIIKIDSLGNKQWDKDFGGTENDYLRSLYQTADGGFIVGGYSQSGISGDKTQDIWDVCLTCADRADYWIVKTDSLGNKQWDKDFGAKKAERLYSLQETTDGGFILGGISFSGISGDKTQPNWGTGSNTCDYWILKTDSLGNKQWDKRFGGTANDLLYALQQTADGGYILGGYSFSGIGGDKTQPNWDTSGIITSDYWIVKIDSLGNKQWDKNFGGTDFDNLSALKQTSDGGFILQGLSSSDSSGDKTQNCVYDSIFLNATWDYWIVKTDSLGNKQWDKDFGGPYIEENDFSTISLTADGGYLIAGPTYSSAGGNKTENNLGPEQTWIIKTDSSGNIQWDKTIFTPGHDEGGAAIQTKDGCYAIANQSMGAIGGYKTQDPWGGPFDFDYWIVKFCDSTLTTGISNLQITNSNFQIVPNPSNGSFLVPGLKFPVERIELFNLLGEPVLAQQPEIRNRSEGIPSGKLETHLPNGMYIIKAYTDKGVFQQKLVIQK